MFNMETKIPVAWPAAPGNASTICLFTTHDFTLGGSVQSALIKGVPPGAQINAIEFVWLRNDQASNANGVRLFALDDTDTFREVDCKNYLNAPTIGSAAPIQVPVLAAGQEWHLIIDVSRYRGVNVQYTAGATGPTNWNGTIFAHLGIAALQR